MSASGDVRLRRHGVEHLTAASRRLFFSAPGEASGLELWTSDGTADGTVLVRDVAQGEASSRPRWLTAYDGRLFFSADDGTSGRELWTSDGTAVGTARVADLAPDLPGPFRLSPPEPTAADQVVVRIESTWSDGCVPVFEDVTVDPASRTIEVLAVANATCGGCPSAITEYAFDVPLGRLEAGEYELCYVVREGCSGDETLFARDTFDVLAAPGTLPCPDSGAPGARGSRTSSGATSSTSTTWAMRRRAFRR